MAETYYPSSAGSSGTASGQSSIGTGRLYIRETVVDEKANTSTVRVSYELNVSSNFPYTSITCPLYGSVNVDGQTASLSGSVNIGYTGGFTEKWSREFIVPHNRDGSKTITIQTSGGYGKGGPSARFYATAAQKEYVNAVGTGSITLALTKIDRNSEAYIGGVAYVPYIMGSGGWAEYGAYIGDGRSWH